MSIWTKITAITTPTWSKITAITTPIWKLISGAWESQNAAKWEDLTHKTWGEWY